MVGGDSNYIYGWLVGTPTMGTPTMETRRGNDRPFAVNLNIPLKFFLIHKHAYQPEVVPAKSEKK